MSQPPSDAASFTEWATHRQSALLRTAYLLTGDRHRAEDLVQDALVKVALRWARLREGNPDAYARRVIVNDHISLWRRRRRETTAAAPEGDPSPDPAPATDRRLLVREALGRLTPRQRAVLTLRFYDDLSVREVAEVMGVGEGTVKSQTHLALRRLRELAPELDLRWEESR